MFRPIVLALALLTPPPAKAQSLEIELCDAYASMADVIMELRQTQPDYATASTAWLQFGAGSVSPEGNQMILMMLSLAYAETPVVPRSQRRELAEGFANIIRTQCLAGAF